MRGQGTWWIALLCALLALPRPFLTVAAEEEHSGSAQVLSYAAPVSTLHADRGGLRIEPARHRSIRGALLAANVFRGKATPDLNGSIDACDHRSHSPHRDGKTPSGRSPPAAIS